MRPSLRCDRKLSSGGTTVRDAGESCHEGVRRVCQLTTIFAVYEVLGVESGYIDSARGKAVADAFELRECDDGGCVGNLGQAESKLPRAPPVTGGRESGAGGQLSLLW